MSRTNAARKPAPVEQPSARIIRRPRAGLTLVEAPVAEAKKEPRLVCGVAIGQENGSKPRRSGEECSLLELRPRSGRPTVIVGSSSSRPNRRRKG